MRVVAPRVSPQGCSPSGVAWRMHRLAESSSRTQGGTVTRRLKQAVLVFVVIFAAAQLVRPNRANPPTDSGRTIQAHAGTSSALVAVLNRSCGDCHTNDSVWPAYTQIAPASWLMAYAVNGGRKAVN